MRDRVARQSWFKSVILPHEAALRRRVRKMASAPGIDVEDIVSEVLLRAYAIEDFGRIDRGRPFLLTIARHLMTDLARRRAVVSFDFLANLEHFDPADPAPSPEVATLARDELRLLQQIVDAMPPQCRKVFLLRRIEDLSLNEIAEKMALSVSTVEKHLSKAMGLLTRGLADGDPVPGQGRKFDWNAKDCR